MEILFDYIKYNNELIFIKVCASLRYILFLFIFCVVEILNSCDYELSTKWSSDEMT